MVKPVKGTPQTVDDGAYAHIAKGTVLPKVSLPATTGGVLDIVAPTEFTVIFLYPMTGTPGQPLPKGWLEMPGAFGCTDEACGYRDHVEEFSRLDTTVYGVSTQTSAEQREFAEREHINYPLLSDSEYLLVDALRIPLLRFINDPPRIKRATLVVDRDRVVREIMYPVPEPAANAVHALAAVTKQVA